MDNPGDYEEELNKILTPNNLPMRGSTGFRPNKRPTTAITTTYETIAIAQAERHQVVVVLIKGHNKSI